MKKRLIISAVTVIGGLVSTGVGQAESAHTTSVSKKALAPFLETHCIRCHGPKKQKGQVRFDKAEWVITNNDSAQRWQDVLDVLNGGDMPPEDEEQPSTEDLSAALDLLTGTLLTARNRLTDQGGEIAMRRLNRREYVNSIEAIFGFSLPEDWLPEDAEAELFDTVGSEQFFTSSDLEKYLEVGREIAARGFEWASRPRVEVSVSRSEAEERVTETLRENLADLDNKMRLKQAGASWQEMGFKDEGEMGIIFSQFKSRAGKPRLYLQYPLVDQGVYLAEIGNSTARVGINRNNGDPRASYRLRVRAGVNGVPPEIRKFLRVENNDGTLGVLKVQGTIDAPAILEFEAKSKIGQRAVNFSVRENRADIRVIDGYLNKLDKGGEWAAIWVDWVEVEGPFYESGRAFFETLLRPEEELDEKGRVKPMQWNGSNARGFIELFVREAFRRRSPEVTYVDALEQMFRDGIEEGQNFNQAMGEVMAVVLSSPGFLFIQEQSDHEGGRKELTDRELAIRLSYFLWSSPPDDELYDCAESGSLLKPDILSEQVERLLSDSRSDAFVQGFASQWAELKRFDAITVDESEYIRFNKGVRDSAYREVLEFFGVLVREDLPVSNLIDSDFVVINSVLGEHYGIEGASDLFEKVALPAESPRGGLLGQTAFLTTGSNGERSSPVIRGALVMEKLLHDPPPPPPPNVPELGSASKNPMTNRQMVEAHQKKAQCSSCHKKMDAIGFGLENFDTIGKWRDTETVGRREIPIETGGTIPGGGQFADLDGLKSVLMEQEEALAREMVESLLAYGLGRRIEFSDESAVDGLVGRLADDKFRVRSMIKEVVASDLFRSK